MSADDARGGEIVLHARWQRIFLVAGLLAALLIGLIFATGSIR